MGQEPTHSGISVFADAGHRTALQQVFRFQQNSSGKPLFYVLNSTQYAGVYSSQSLTDCVIGLYLPREI